MSNRFHNKWHRKNHHTYGNASNPDASHDPIASSDQPFLGDFVLQGSLCAVAPMSAFGAYVFSNYTAICAFAGYTAIRAKSFGFPGLDSIGIQVDAQNIAISAHGVAVGLNVHSPVRAISAYSRSIAIEAYGHTFGHRVYSNSRAISAYGSYTAAELYGVGRALSAMSPNLGIEVYSNQRAISAYATNVGIEVRGENTALSASSTNLAGSFYANNRALSAYGTIVAGEFRSPNTGTLIYGGTRALSAYSGYTAAELYGVGRALSAMSPNLGIEVYSNQRAISAYGSAIGAEVYSPNVAISAYSPRIAIRAIAPNKNQNDTNIRALDVTGYSYFDGDVEITGSLSANGYISRFDTYVVVTSSTYIENKGTDTALTVIQRGNIPVAHFYDDGNSAFFIDGKTLTPGYVGINTDTPNERLTIVGNISGYSEKVSFNNSRASGKWSLSEGTSLATGDLSHAEGDGTLASNTASHSEGIRTIASGEASHSSGFETLATGNYSTSIGYKTSALSNFSFAGCDRSVANFREFGFAFGRSNKVTHDTGVALGGNNNLASGPRSHALGSETIASGYESNTEGVRTGTGSRVPFESYNASTKTFTFSPENSAIFFSDHAGNLQITLRGCITGSGSGSFHEGQFFDIEVNPNSSAAYTPNNTLSALKVYYITTGENITTNIGSGKGWIQNGSGWESHAEGYETVASGFRSSHAEGVRTLASGKSGSHAEGYETVASGFHSHSEGFTTTAFASASHAEGSWTRASGEGSHAEGNQTTASGIHSHAAGSRATASKNNSYIWSGDNTLLTNVQTTLDRQYLIYAPSGVFIPRGMVGIGIGTDYVNNDAGTVYPLTVNGPISSKGLRLWNNSTITFADYSINNDQAFIGMQFDAPDYGRLVIQTADNQAEPIVFRQYSFSNNTSYNSLVIGQFGNIGMGTGTLTSIETFNTNLAIYGTLSSYSSYVGDKLYFGSGLSPDTNLYRSAADTLKTDDSFIVDGASTTINSTTITLGDANTDTVTINSGPVNFPSATSAADALVIGVNTNLYRSADNILKTDDNLMVTGTVSATNFISVNGIIPIAVTIPFNFKAELGTIWPSNFTVPYGYRFVVTGTGPCAFYETVVGTSPPTGNLPAVQLMRSPTTNSGYMSPTYFGDAVNTTVPGECTIRSFGVPTANRRSAQFGDIVSVDVTTGSTISYTSLSGKLIFTGVLIPTNI